jgi:ribonuclease HI
MIYTDASKTQEPSFTASAIFHYQRNFIQSFKINDIFSIFSAEAIAILHSLFYIETLNKRLFVIFSDSKSVLLSLMSNNVGLKTSPIILQIRKKYYDLSLKGFSIAFAWVPSHIGIHGNEVVDRAAKTASVQNLSYYPSFFDIKNLFTSKAYNNWQINWDLTSKFNGNRLYQLKKSVSSPPWFSSCSKNRRFITSICRMRIGHTYTNLHLSKINVLQNSMCDCNKDSASLDHLIFACPLNDEESINTLFKELTKLKVKFPVNILTLLEEMDENVLDLIFDFIVNNIISI